MRRFLVFTFLLALSSCSVGPNEDYSTGEVLEEISIDYPDQFICWDDLFKQKEEIYFIYVFAYDCYHCKQTKKHILEFYERSEFTVYFVEYSKQIPIGHNTTNTLGKTELIDVFIRGTPSLIMINKGVISFNVAGKSEVNELIDLYLQNQ